MAIICRRSQPPQLRNYRSFKRYLRRDFKYRCGYCTVHEGEYHAGGVKSFCVEHFRPRNRFPELECVYDNLYYACRHCNENKGTHWPSEELLRADFRFLDPCAEDYYDIHINVNTDGRLEPNSNPARYTTEHIRLNRPFLVRLRASRHSTAVQMRIIEDQLQELETNNGAPQPLLQAVRDRLADLQQRHLYPAIPYELAEQR